ncbi:MAG: acetyl-CoA carboxylase carboxyltransferase subunit beta [Alphaproteobacteria bacterium]|nr:acetyl-CoA carboxylase carboxyltransferase subunit beta [Alphaproteobacteria bacterium]
MNWLTNFIRPKIRSMVAGQKEVPDNLWQKCPSCDGMLFHRELKENSNVCYHCGHHLKIYVTERLDILFDDGYDLLKSPAVKQDPLKFKDRKRYADRLKEAKAKTEREDAIVLAQGTIGGFPVIVAAFDFEFMGGSMGAAVGEGILRAAEVAVEEQAALIVVPASGGARMQEGAISLMQMPRTVIARQLMKEARLPYFVLLTDPTTGGVSASFAMLGDVHIAEPGAMIGFAGKRVIEETIRQQLPDGFQTAEYLVEHGMVDMVVARKDQRATFAKLLGFLMPQSAALSVQHGGKSKRVKTGASGKALESAHKASGNIARYVADIPADLTAANSDKKQKRAKR